MYMFKLYNIIYTIFTGVFKFNYCGLTDCADSSVVHQMIADWLLSTGI